jgi:hypothetical protein
MAIKIPSGYKIYQHFPLQGLQKYSQFGIFILQTYQLATLDLSLGFK